MTLRELRLWHWRRALYARTQARISHEAAEAWEAKYPTAGRCRASRNNARDFNRRADFHIGAVQACNDFVSGTAEEDAALADNYRGPPQ